MLSRGRGYASSEGVSTSKGQTSGLEVISKWLGEDEDHAEVEEGEVVVGFAVVAGGDAAFCFQPGVGAFDREAVRRLRVGCA